MTPVVFIAMSFSKVHQAGLEQVILPAVKRTGAEGVRADHEKQGHIHSQMFARLVDSQAVVIDLSGLNPNVFYEMGVAHASHRRSIMVINEEHLKGVPFDVAPYRVLVYPDPATATPGQIAEVIEKLAGEIRHVLEHPEIGIPNPVIDFLTTRSPVTAEQTLHLSSLKEEYEREIILGAQRHLTYFGLTGQVAFKIIELVETGVRSLPFELRLRLLHPQYEQGWRFMDELARGKPCPQDEIDDYIEGETSVQRRAVKKLRKLVESYPGFTLDVKFYKTIPLFWAYGWDDKKWAVGHYAMRRIQARGLPVTVIAASDPQSGSLFAHYSQIIQDLPFAPVE